MPDASFYGAVLSGGGLPTSTGKEPICAMPT